MNLSIWFYNLILISLLMMLFFLASKKEMMSKNESTTFECGFSSYFYSRLSFSIQFYIVALIFLFLDLELCVIMPFFLESKSSIISSKILILFILTLLWSLLQEWKDENLEWKK